MDITENNYRLLIVDDNPAIHDDFKKILIPDEDPIRQDQLENLKETLFGHRASQKVPLSYAIDSAYSGSEALKLSSQAVQEGKPYALAFVDVLMPTGLNGVETTKRLWKVDPEIQIVICTAYADYSWNEMIEQLGINDNFVILKKPFDNIEIKQLACCLTQKWQLSKQVGHQFDRINEEIARKSQDLTVWTR